MQRHISYSTRATIARNAEHDPAKPRYARVPQGTFTCAFCVMLASRGWVYPSEETARTAKGGGAYHNHCDCMIVPEWDREVAHIEGYDPDKLYEMYQNGRAESGSQDPRDIAQAMRRLYPTQLSDGLDVVRGNKLASEWLNTRPVAAFGGTSLLPGRFTNPTGAALTYGEYQTARALAALGEEIEWLPLRGIEQSNDFLWLSNGAIEVETKATSARYKAIQRHIRGDVGEVKRNFLIDLGDVPLREPLRKQLLDYNLRNPHKPIDRLWVLAQGNLVEINLR